MRAEKPSVFIGTSREGLEVGRAIQFQLREDALVSIWNEGVFGLSQGTLESLVNNLDRFDFAVLVITPDDVVISREIERQAPRDNVLFELGLFMGRLGRLRTLVVSSNAAQLKLPSDLAGVTVEWYNADHAIAPLIDRRTFFSVRVVRVHEYSNSSTDRQRSVRISSSSRFGSL